MSKQSSLLSNVHRHTTVIIAKTSSTRIIEKLLRWEKDSYDIKFVTTLHDEKNSYDRQFETIKGPATVFGPPPTVFGPTVLLHGHLTGLLILLVSTAQPSVPSFFGL
jgi:DNA-dependent RNA polymerase auxiliary subunit epsilon